MQSFLSQAALVRDAFLHTLPTLPHHHLWPTHIQIEKAEAASNKSEIFQIDLDSALGLDGSESHQGTVVEVTKEGKQVSQ